MKPIKKIDLQMNRGVSCAFIVEKGTDSEQQHIGYVGKFNNVWNEWKYCLYCGKINGGDE